MNIPQAICPSCGIEHFGWALANPCHRRCGSCGAQLIVEEICPVSSGVELSRPLPQPQPIVDIEEEN